MCQLRFQLLHATRERQALVKMLSPVIALRVLDADELLTGGALIFLDIRGDNFSAVHCRLCLPLHSLQTLQDAPPCTRAMLRLREPSPARPASARPRSSRRPRA